GSAEQLKHKHAQLLNLSLKRTQRHHSGICAFTFQGTTALYCIVGSFFRTDEADCLALRADIMVFVSAQLIGLAVKFHMVVTASKKQSRVSRNAFGAEVQLPTERHLAYAVMKVREWLDRK
ncbi:unnamed protein product, partial [Prorocentrum cordatum]